MVSVARIVVSFHVPSLGQSSDDLQDEDTTTNTATANLSALLPADARVIINGKELGLDSCSPRLLSSHAKVENVPGVVHRYDQHALFIVDAIHGSMANLLGRRRGEDAASYRGGHESMTDIARKGRFVTGTSA
jgi:hypothetical protein